MSERKFSVVVFDLRELLVRGGGHLVGGVGTGALEGQAQQIEDVLSAILDMDSQSKCVLLALYYPFRSYKEAADFLHMAKATIYRQRKTALDSLFATMYKSESFR